MNILEHIWRNSNANRTWKPCDICGDPIREGKLCNDCWEIDRRLAGFLLCQNGIDYMKSYLKDEAQIRLEKAAPALLEACKWLLSAYEGMLKQSNVKYKAGQIPGITQAQAAIKLAEKGE